MQASDGFQHGLPEHAQRDEARARFLAADDIGELRFWNHQWRQNWESVLFMDIWVALHRRTGCVKAMRKERNHRFVPPNPELLIPKPDRPPISRPRH